MEMNASDKEVIAQLEAMTLEQARREIASGTFGRPGSGNHDFASKWFTVKEAESRDKRDASVDSISRKALRNSNWANIIAFLAFLLSALAIALSWSLKK
jgi:hypothetical protein